MMDHDTFLHRIALASIHRILALFALSILLTSCGAPRIPVTLKTQSGDVVIQAEQSITPAERQRGLMGRRKLEDDEGMLFLLPKPDNVSFWMKNTLIPLDMIFIGGDLRITEIAHDQQPCPPQSACVGYPTSKPAQYVLEINGGLAEKIGILVGDSVSF